MSKSTLDGSISPSDMKSIQFPCSSLVIVVKFIIVLQLSRFLNTEVMGAMDTSIFGAGNGLGGGALSTGDNFARGDMRIPRVFGGVSSRGQKVKSVNVKKLSQNVLKRKGK